MKPKIKFPYGRSNFRLLIKDGYHYVDKTPYVEWLEESDESFVFFLRPRRFGKSLFVSVLQHYYGIEYESEFETLFGKFYIGQHPTPLKNSYSILKFNFSGINTSTLEKTLQGFLANVRYSIEGYIIQYLSLPKAVKQNIVEQPEANLMLLALYKALKDQDYPPIYLLIDEYDHFTNELMAYDFTRFQESVSENGFIRKFYETIKNGTDEGRIHRIFITGVSPITLDSMTSGFNIGTHFTLEEKLNEMMGFSEKEVLSLLEKVVPVEKQPAILEDMRQWYNGYLFNQRATNRVYNSDMVLYFLGAYKRNARYPDEMLDTNISSDYGKLRRLFNLRTPIQNYQILKEIVDGKKQTANIVAEFSFKRPFDKNDFLSLLFYLGFLTIKGSEFGLLELGVPNYVIQQLYFDFFIAHLTEQEEIPSRLSQLQISIIEMARDGNPQLFFQEVEHVLKHLSRRDYRGLDEKHLKAIMIALATQVDTYFVKSEREYQNGYADIVFLERLPVRVHHQFIMELKYLKQTESKQLSSVQKKAKTQLLNYIQAEEELNALKNLQAWTVVVMKDKLIRERVL